MGNCYLDDSFHNLIHILWDFNNFVVWYFDHLLVLNFNDLVIWNLGN